MSLPKIKEILALSNDQIENEIMETKKFLFELRVLKGTRQSFKPHSFRHFKHKVNQLLMVKTQRDLETKKGKN